MGKLQTSWETCAKDFADLKKKKKKKAFLSPRHKTQVIYCYEALFTNGQFLHFIAACERLPDVRPISLVLQTSSQAAFYRKGENSCLSFLRNAFLYLSICHYTSELYKRPGGTMSLVDTFHCSVAPFLAWEASAQRSWRLGTAATGSPGLMAGHSLSVTLQWPL
uniref:Macaca fascicularis brain cDNA clone: QorA-13157, similar to human chemokine (C-X-C motif) ligand 14 (CXCL14), mRNA, RefSeq: NM_004887.3 n=1 Tax=Macaca fascicularis TaxID=9541 RepID=I7G9T9_MACFA|nr:unnamed protein product [Macaca fascicularis]